MSSKIFRTNGPKRYWRSTLFSENRRQPSRIVPLYCAFDCSRTKLMMAEKSSPLWPSLAKRS